MSETMAYDPTRAVPYVEEELGFAQEELVDPDVAETDYADQVRGVIAALEWALGRSDWAPASFKLVPSPDWRTQRNEAEWANEIEVGIRPMPEGMNRHYARGVGSALRWTSGDTDVTPA